MCPFPVCFLPTLFLKEERLGFNTAQPWAQPPCLFLAPCFTFYLGLCMCFAMLCCNFHAESKDFIPLCVGYVGQLPHFLKYPFFVVWSCIPLIFMTFPPRFLNVIAISSLPSSPCYLRSLSADIITSNLLVSIRWTEMVDARTLVFTWRIEFIDAFRLLLTVFFFFFCFLSISGQRVISLFKWFVAGCKADYLTSSIMWQRAILGVANMV